MRMGDLMVGTSIMLAAILAALLSGAVLFLAGAFWSVLRDRFGGPFIPWQKYDVLIMTGYALVTAAMTLMLERWSGRNRPLVGLGLVADVVVGPVAWRPPSGCPAQVISLSGPRSRDC